MRSELFRKLSKLHEPKEFIDCKTWNADNTDFSKEPSYDTEIKTKYNPDLIPLYKEIQDNLTDISIREQWIVKPSRAGATESCLLNPLRYTVGHAPRQTLFVSGNQLSTERMAKDRIKLGFLLNDYCKRQLKLADVTEHDIRFPTMSLTLTWPKSPMAFKQSGYSLILCDEVSMWGDVSVALLRKRADTYAFSHIIGLSSMNSESKNSSTKDPIWIQYLEGDQRKWMMPDPKTGELFSFRKGDESTYDGLKWDKECRDEKTGKWDIDMVKATAFYRTPSGYEIRTDEERLAIIKTGHWVATNPKAPKAIRSYHLNAFYLPFKSGEFGHIAAAWVVASKQGKRAIRSFVLEYLAEEFLDDDDYANKSILSRRERDYHKESSILAPTSAIKDFYIGKTSHFLLTTDVQKWGEWSVVREWIGSDSALIDWFPSSDFAQIQDKRTKYKCKYWVSDFRYRQTLVMDAALKYKMIPIINQDNLPQLIKQRTDLDPYEGTKDQGKMQICSYSFKSHFFRSLLLDFVNGRGDGSWMVYKNPEYDYQEQLLSTKFVHSEEGKGEWKATGQDHLFDCEVYQCVLATILGIYRPYVVSDVPS